MRKIVSYVLLCFFALLYVGAIVTFRSGLSSLLFLIASVVFILSVIFSPKEPPYDVIRFVLLFLLLLGAWTEGTLIYGLVLVAVAAVLLPFVIRRYSQCRTKPRLPVCEEEQEYFGDWFDEREAKRKCRTYFEKQGFSRVRETRDRRGYTEYTARDKYGQEWIFRCERSGSKVNISGTPGKPPELKPDALRSIEILEMFSDE